jgi:hypothetical protein
VDELEMLEKYEPVLRFAKSERFFPMAVEPYLERCVLFSSGPQGAIESVTHLGGSLLERLGKLESEQHYLRYVNNPLRDSDAWVWWAASSSESGFWAAGILFRSRQHFH